MAKDYRLEKRKFVIGGIALTIVLIYLIRLFVLQITTDDYKKNADSNAFLNKIQYPSRGAIYDRNGKLLVFNQPAYDIKMCIRDRRKTVRDRNKKLMRLPYFRKDELSLQSKIL